jgi:hypothetical protein
LAGDGRALSGKTKPISSPLAGARNIELMLRGKNEANFLGRLPGVDAPLRNEANFGADVEFVEFVECHGSRPGLLVRGLDNGPEIQANTRAEAFRLLWKGRC